MIKEAVDTGLSSRSFYSKTEQQKCRQSQGENKVSTPSRPFLKQLFNLYSHVGIKRGIGTRSTINKFRKRNYCMLAKQFQI